MKHINVRIHYNYPVLLIFSLLLSITGCATYQPEPIDTLNFRDRAISKTEDGITVSVVVLSAEESEAAFGTPLAREGIQPVWLEIENTTEHQLLFLKNRLDSNYFSPHEASWKSHYFASGDANQAMDHYFLDMHIPVVIEPQQTASGFVYSNVDEGLKYVRTDLLRKGHINSFWFVVEVPGLEADYKQVDWDSLYNEDEIKDIDNMEELKTWLEALPCCVLGGDKKTPGDPLNLIVIAPDKMLAPAFISRQWDVTETMHGGAIWGTIKSSLFGVFYRTSPVSPLYLFDRPQDFALQKARDTVDERNHLRLWLAPVRYKGMNVFAGQISRDIGVRLSSKTFVTHKIDPAVDEARTYLGLDLFMSEWVHSYGYVEGVGQSTFIEPSYNYTNDPYHTDGRRLVIIIADQWTDILDIERIDWTATKEAFDEI